MPGALLQSFFLGGFESSTMRRRDGRRNDLVAATRHDDFAVQDYERLRSVGMLTVREGAAWHRIEARPGRFDPASVLSRMRAAEALGIQVIWDLCHFGWPDDLDPFAAEFPDRLGTFATWFARLLREESAAIPWYVPVNEPSFVAWAGGDVEYLDPFQRGRGNELKRQLVRAAVAAAAAVREVDARARICHVDPVIHIEPQPGSDASEVATARHNEAQFEAWDMLAGRLDDDLGGSDAELDVIGANFYDRNQWVDGGPTLRIGDPGFRPLRSLLADVHQRYRRPIIVAETGTEGSGRAPWLRYVADEVAAARADGIAVEGICLYPILDHPGWDDDRHVPVGVWGYPDATGDRPVHQPLRIELGRQVARFAQPETTAAGPGTSRSTVAPAGQERRASIVLVTDSRTPSGVGHQMLTLARGLSVRNRVVVAAPDAIDARWLLERARVVGLETWPLADGGPSAQAASLGEYLMDDRIDLVNVHAGIGWEGQAATGAARAAGVGAVVRTEHLPYVLTKPGEQARYHASLADLDRVIAVSYGVARSHRLAGIPETLIRVVQNGIEEPGTAAETSAVRAGLGVEMGTPLVVSIGRLTTQKGYDMLLAAAESVVRHRSETRFVIVGAGPQAAELDASIADLGLGGRILRLSHHDDIPALLAAADLLALPSRFEGLPLVALEAMAVGRPVVGTRVCGIEETVDDGVTGRLVAAEDVESFGAAILELLDDPTLARRYGAAGRDRFEARFTAARMVEETERVFAALLAGQAPETAGIPVEAEAPIRTLTSIR